MQLPAVLTRFQVQKFKSLHPSTPLRVVVRVPGCLPARQCGRHRRPAAGRPPGPAPATTIRLRQHRRGVRRQPGAGEWTAEGHPAGPKADFCLRRHSVVLRSAGVRREQSGEAVEPLLRHESGRRVPGQILLGQIQGLVSC